MHCVVSGYMNFASFWMAPWDAGGTHGDGCQLCVTFWRILLQSMIRLSCRSAIVNGLDRNMKIDTESPRLPVTPGEWYASDLLATMSTDLRQMKGIPDVIGAVKIDCRTVWGFPQIDSAVVDCVLNLNFRRTSFPPDEFSAGREGDYIWLALLASSSVRTRSVTGSLRLGSSHRLVCSCLCSTVLSLRWIESADVPQCRHFRMAVSRSMPDICASSRALNVERYSLRPSVTVILIICCCFRIFRVRDMASDGLPDGEQAGPSYGSVESLARGVFRPFVGH